MDKSQILWAIVVVLGISAICTASAWSCTVVNTRYYDSMKVCLDNGGSWVPSSGGGYASSCINPHATK